MSKPSDECAKTSRELLDAWRSDMEREQELRDRLAELEQLEESNGELRREMDAQLAELEKELADAAERYLTKNDYDGLWKALRAAGYLK